MKKTFENNVITKVHRVIETEPIEDTDFAYYKDICHIDVDGKMRKETHQGITSKANLKAIHGLEDVSNIVSHPKLIDGTAIVAVIYKEDFNRTLEGKEYIADIVEPTDTLSFPIPEDYMLVLFHPTTNIIADLHYKFIPQPITFDTIFVANDIYDLNKLLLRLKEDEHVLGRENLKITSIPSYNCWDNHTKTIEFSYLPDKEIYQDLAPLTTFDKKRYVLKNLLKADDFLVERDENEEDLEWL